MSGSRGGWEVEGGGGCKGCERCERCEGGRWSSKVVRRGCGDMEFFGVCLDFRVRGNDNLRTLD